MAAALVNVPVLAGPRMADLTFRGYAALNLVHGWV